MTGIFAEWQPRYAERGIATFPVREKKPAVRGYLKIGQRASGQFAIKFPSDDAFGFACRRNRITVVDVDAPDERLLADALDEYGTTPLVVRSGSGHFQAWYRHNGERRRVRPDPRRPIDILGDGFVVAPPSKGAKGGYSIICGSLDDLGSLPTMHGSAQPEGLIVPANDAAATAATGLVPVGRRNEALWRHCMKAARHWGHITSLWEKAMDYNRSELSEPLPSDEVRHVVDNAWRKETSGQNWFGRGGRVVFDKSEVDALLQSHPDAFILLTKLRSNHWGRTYFVVANAMSESMPGGGWGRLRFAKARRALTHAGLIEQVRPASKYHGPALFKFKGVQI